MAAIDLFIQEVLLGQRVPTANELGNLADYFKVIEEERRKADKEAERLKTMESNIRSVLVSQMSTQGISAVGGRVFKVEYYTSDEPTVKDWPKFYSYILKTKDFSLLERRPGKAAIKERWNDGKEVPGIDKFPVDKLSFTKVKGT